MPSPFPGMDPYLESPGLWPDVHHGLVSQIQATLNARLRPHYVVRVELRVYVSDEEDPGRQVMVPDVRVEKGTKSKNGRSRPPQEVTPRFAGTVYRFYLCERGVCGWNSQSG